MGVRRLREVLESGEFVTTVEYNPPKGTDIIPIMDNAKALLGKVHGVNVTDNTAAILRAGSLSVCRMLYEMGHDPVMQVTCRDRNRLAIQSDLLSAHILGIRNIPGVDVPQAIIEELRAAGDERALDVGVQIAVRTIKAVRAHCDGVHIMAIKAVDRLPEILHKAELA